MPGTGALHARAGFAIPIIAILTAFLLHALVVAVPYVSAGRHGWFSFPFTDDAYYYFQPAWNLVHGRGLTMDSVSSTNGFHPLWMGVVVLLAAVSSTKAALLSNVVFAAVLTFYLSAAAQGLLVHALFSRRLLTFAAVALYLVLPQVFSQHLNGLETGLVLLWSFVSLYVLLRLLRAGRAVSPRTSALLGVSTALLFLSRTDMIFCVLAIAVVGLHSISRGGGNTTGETARSTARMLRQGIAFSLPHVLLAGPWLGWNLARFGSIVQGSAFVFPVLARRYYSVYYDYHQILWDRFLPPGLCYAFSDTVERATVGIPTGAFVALVLLAVLVVGRACLRATRRAYFCVVGVLGASLCALSAVHVCVRMSPRPWYFVQAQLMLILAVAGALHALRKLGRARGLTVVVAVLLMGAIAYRNADLLGELARPRRASASELAMREEALYARVPPEITVMGHTDSGRFTFFAPERLTVVNLDGLINNAAGRAVRRGRLMDYIVAGPTEYVILRPNIGNTEAVMGRGYRRFLKVIGPLGGMYEARVLRQSAEVRHHLALPRDGTIRPARADHWQYLLGEWRFTPGGDRETRVGVQNCGIQFAIEAGGQHAFEVVLASPYAGVTIACGVLIDGRSAGSIECSDGGPHVFSVPTGRLEPGIHEIVLANKDRLSARMLGLSDDGTVRSYTIHSFRVTPAVGHS
jgi:hypothetical protein